MGGEGIHPIIHVHVHVLSPHACSYCSSNCTSLRLYLVSSSHCIESGLCSQSRFDATQISSILARESMRSFGTNRGPKDSRKWARGHAATPLDMWSLAVLFPLPCYFGHQQIRARLFRRLIKRNQKRTDRGQGCGGLGGFGEKLDERRKRGCGDGGLLRSLVAWLLGSDGALVGALWTRRDLTAAYKWHSPSRGSLKKAKQVVGKIGEIR